MVAALSRSIIIMAAAMAAFLTHMQLCPLVVTEESMDLMVESHKNPPPREQSKVL